MVGGSIFSVGRKTEALISWAFGISNYATPSLSMDVAPLRAMIGRFG